MKEEDAAKVCIVTGANTGIGKETVHGMVKAGYFVVLACRSVERGENARESIASALGSAEEQEKEDSGSKKKEQKKKKKKRDTKDWAAMMRVMQLDLSDLDSVRECSATFHKEFTSLHILILNAGERVSILSTYVNSSPHHQKVCS